MSSERFRELDALRGGAVVLMVLYHLAFDLSYFYGWPVLRILGEGGDILARATASLFLLVIGICFVISWQRTPSYQKCLRRGLIILSGGMLISFATWLIAPHAFVKFGILHLIGTSALLQPLFTPLKLWNALLGLLVLLVFLVLPAEIPSPFLFPLGITYPGFASIDYYPLLPWYGVILIGMALGDLLYTPQRRLFFQKLDALPYPPSLLATGKYSLWIYLVHQPLILMLLALILGTPMK